MFRVHKNHVLSRCKIAIFSIVMLEIFHGSSHAMFRKSESNYERFIIKFIEKSQWTKSFLSILQACKRHPD